MISNSEPRVKARKRYTQQACIECQRRKRKCTGETVCSNCRYTDIECIYAQSRSSRQRRETQTTPSDSAPGDCSAIDIQPYAQIPPRPRPDGESLNNDLTSRTRILEQGYASLRRELASLKSQEPSRAAVRESQSSAARPEKSAALPSASTPRRNQESARWNNALDPNTSFMGSTSLFRQIDVLNRSVACDLGNLEEYAPASLKGRERQATDHERSATSPTCDIDRLLEQTRLEDLDKVRQSLDIYFANVQPSHPCINEAHFRSQLTAFLADGSSCMSKVVAVQFATLLNFMMSAVRILNDFCTQDDYTPGWEEFCRAEKLLGHGQCLENANIMTIQILLVKTLYYGYVSKLNAAYDTMSTAIRICFQLGLHNEPSWGDGCSFYDRTYRQRVFWCAYCLYHNVAQNAGAPDLLRESDFEVSLPKCVDDRMLYPTCPPIRELQKASPVPLLLEIIKWAKLASEIWDAMFGVRARRPISSEFIASTDNKIVQVSMGVPSFLQWPSGSGSQNPDAVPGFILQQSFILFLRIQHLRLLLRREEMVGLTYERRTAQLCVEIATEVINAVELYSSTTPKRIDRYAYTLYLTGAIVPMICIIIRRNNGDDLILPAINLLNRSLKLLEAIAQGLSFARYSLEQLDRPIQVARQMINSHWPQYSHSASVNFNLLASPMTLIPNQTWNSGGNVAIANVCDDPVVEDAHRLGEDNLMWEDLDLWSSLNSWSA